MWSLPGGLIVLHVHGIVKFARAEGALGFTAARPAWYPCSTHFPRQPLDTLFLQEVPASILVHDLRAFRALAAQLGAVDLALCLSRFYEHATAAIEPHGGRVVKFMADTVLSVFVGAGDAD